MKKCQDCGGHLLASRGDITRIIDGRLVKVDIIMDTCADCGQVFPDTGISLESIDRLLRNSLRANNFDRINWEDLISERSFALSFESD